jgi:2,3-dihydroxyphenylpropionate 1,2-dioxygenase
MSSKSAERPGIVGAAIVPHAPQFLTLPETEDKAQVARVNAAMRAIGDKFRTLDPDLLIVLSNAHCDDFVVHCVPAFAIHCGRRAEGSGGHHGPWPIDGEAGYALLRQLLDLGFDPAFTLDAKLGTAFTIPLDFCGYPRERRSCRSSSRLCAAAAPRSRFAFGRRWRMCDRAGRASCGRAGQRRPLALSGNPALPGPRHDRVIFERLAAGNLRYLMSLDAAALDRSGNVECRSLQILAGMIGDRLPDSAVFEPSWHHIYAVLGWTDLAPVKAEPLHYPATDPERRELARAIFAVVDDAAAQAAFLQDRDGYVARFELDADERAALSNLDREALRERFAINPMLLYQLEARIKSS